MFFMHFPILDLKVKWQSLLRISTKVQYHTSYIVQHTFSFVNIVTVYMPYPCAIATCKHVEFVSVSLVLDPSLIHTHNYRYVSYIKLYLKDVLLYLYRVDVYLGRSVGKRLDGKDQSLVRFESFVLVVWTLLNTIENGEGVGGTVCSISQSVGQR